ncbi:TRAP transporter substrate-binding protein [Rhodophyticola porphyridii]|uniref:TRAP transporter substrate-binding protein n=1 Tax=Rhodophyticola porphyridii TaxID=1852017 RepID=UPI0035CF8859
MFNRRQVLGGGLGAAALMLGGPAQAQQRTLKFASATLNDVQHQYQQRFAERLAVVSDTTTVELYPASQLGPIPRMVEGVMFGTIESFITATAFLSQVDPRFQVFDVATIFRDPEATRDLFAGEEFRSRVRTFGNAQNIEPISTFVHSPNTIISKRPIRSLNDLSGLKIRVLGTPFQIEPMRALGATPVPMPLSEVMPALQTGTIDAVISAPTVAAAFRYYDAASYMTMIDSWPLIVTVATSRSWLNGLPDDVRTQIVSVARDTEAEAVEWGAADVTRAAEAWVANGGEVIPLEADMEAALQSTIAEATAPLIDASTPLSEEVAALSRMVEEAG